MNPSERIKNIETKSIDGDGCLLSEYYDVAWLIARCKKLTEALEFYADESTYENWYIHGSVLYEEKAEIARKALESES